MVSAAFVPLFWFHLSPFWTAEQASRAHQQGDYPTAIYWYHRSLRRGQDPAWAWYNLAEIYGYQKNSPEYARALRQLRKVDEKGAREVEAGYGPPEPPKNADPDRQRPSK